MVRLSFLTVLPGCTLSPYVAVFESQSTKGLVVVVEPVCDDSIVQYGTLSHRQKFIWGQTGGQHHHVYLPVLVPARDRPVSVIHPEVIDPFSKR